MNKVILIGRLTADPNLRYTQNGTPVTTFTLAVDKPFVDKDGKRGADFIDIVAWRKLAEVVAQNITKAAWWPWEVGCKSVPTTTRTALGGRRRK